MASFEIFWKSSAEHDLRKIDHQYISKIIKTVEGLSENPFPNHSRKLKGSESSYRVIYQVDSQNSVVTIFHVRHRKEAYGR